MEQTPRNAIIAIAIEHDFKWEDILTHILTKKKPNFDYLEGVETDKFVTIIDKDYPEKYKRAKCPPFVYERGANE